MKNITVCLLFVLVGTFSFAQTVSKEGQFTVDFPGEATFMTDAAETELGEMTLNMYMYEASAKEVYMVSWSEYPEGELEDSDESDVINSGLDGAFENVGITNREEVKEGKFQGHPSIFARGKIDGSYHAIYQIILVDNKLYQVAVLSDGYYISKQDEKKFFGSFKFLK